MEVVDLKNKVEFQAKTTIHMEKMCKDLRLRVDLLIDKANRLSKKKDKGLDVMVQSQLDERVSKVNRKKDIEFYPEQIDWECTIKGIKEGTI